MGANTSNDIEDALPSVHLVSSGLDHARLMKIYHILEGGRPPTVDLVGCRCHAVFIFDVALLCVFHARSSRIAAATKGMMALAKSGV